MGRTRNLWGAAAAVVYVGVITGPTAAQTPEQGKMITKSLQDGQRVQMEGGSPIDPKKAGYYRVTVKSDQMTPANLCWQSKDERSHLEKLGDTVWSWALKKKKDWGASVQLVFDGSQPNWDDSALKPNFLVKLFAVHVDGSSPSECQPAVIDFGRYVTPPIPLEESIKPTLTYVQIQTWYNDVADRDAINGLASGGSALLALIGLPMGALQQFQPLAVDKFKATVDKNKPASYRTSLDPLSASENRAVGYVGLRTPSAANKSSDAQVKVSVEPIASIFAPLNMSFDDVNLSGADADWILKYPIPTPTPANPAAFSYLDALIGNKTPLYNAMLTEAGVPEGTCSLLAMALQNEFKFSSTDAAIILYGIVRTRMANGLTKYARDLPCLIAREEKLGRVKIKLALGSSTTLPGGSGMAGDPATQSQMLDALNNFAQFRTTPLDEQTTANGAIFAFPLTVFDPADNFGWPNSQMQVADKVALRALFNEKLTNAGCWAYFVSPPFGFAPGLGAALLAGSDNKVRKAAALVRLADGSVQVMQFRFNADVAGSKIDGIALAKNDADAKARMLDNDSCKPGPANKAWMQAYLRPGN